MSTKDNKGTAVITGASSGIGAARHQHQIVTLPRQPVRIDRADARGCAGD
ncbi:MAG: SDR family oxidoreductase, partial [Mesorhizobium sp.]